MPAVFQSINGSIELSDQVIISFVKKFAKQSPFFQFVNLKMNLVDNKSTFIIDAKAIKRDNVVSETNVYTKLLTNAISTNLGLTNCVVIVRVIESK